MLAPFYVKLYLSMLLHNILITKNKNTSGNIDVGWKIQLSTKQLKQFSFKCFLLAHTKPKSKMNMGVKQSLAENIISGEFSFIYEGNKILSWTKPWKVISLNPLKKITRKSIPFIYWWAKMKCHYVGKK